MTPQIEHMIFFMGVSVMLIIAGMSVDSHVKEGVEKEVDVI